MPSLVIVLFQKYIMLIKQIYNQLSKETKFSKNMCRVLYNLILPPPDGGVPDGGVPVYGSA